MKQKAYDEAYQAYMESPYTLEQLARIEEAELEYASGKTTQNPHSDLKRQKVEVEAQQAGEKAKKTATPNNPLGVAVMLRQYIRFVRIKPEAQGQKAPLYFYHPDDGIWLEDNEFLQDLIAVIFPSATEKHANDTLYKIARKSPLRTVEREYTVIGQQLYNYKDNGFRPLTHEVIVTRKVKTRYNPDAVEPTINGWKPTQWLLELFDGDKELANLAIQIIKASVTGQSLKKIFWLYGEGGTGKGTFQQLLINLVGMENVASLRITDTSKNNFRTSILLGKSLVIGDDVQKDILIKDTSDMFSLATGDIMTIEQKGKQPYSIKFNMTIVQSSNGLPRMTGDKSAIDRRFRVLPFTKVFKDKPNKAIKNDYIDRKAVLEYLVKLAIETPLVDIDPAKSVEILEEHHKDINPVYDFVGQFFTDELVSEFIPNSFVYHVWKEFVNYYEVNHHKTEIGLHRDIKTLLPDGYQTGQRIIPAGRNHHIGFYPKEDLPPFARSGLYSNGRESPERNKKPKNERGYFNNRPKKRKKG